MEMTALLDGRMRREATVAGELEITILADLSKLPTTSPWLSDWLSAAWCPCNLLDRCVYFTNKTGADARTRTADLLITNQHYVFAKHENSDSHSRARAR